MNIKQIDYSVSREESASRAVSATLMLRLLGDYPTETSGRLTESDIVLTMTDAMTELMDAEMGIMLGDDEINALKNERSQLDLNNPDVIVFYYDPPILTVHAAVCM